jgi:hypothetical protein
LEGKRRFFDSPRAYFGNVRHTNPALSFVIGRMLERDPDARWPDTSVLADILADLSSGGVPITVREHAAEDYRNRLHNNETFFRTFYEQLFSKSHEVRQIFESIGGTTEQRMIRQYTKLDYAMRDLFLFEPRLSVSSLDCHVEFHQAFALEQEHFSVFAMPLSKACNELPGRMITRKKRGQLF